CSEALRRISSHGGGAFLCKIAEVHCIAIHKIKTRIALQNVHHIGQMVRQPRVVAIEKCNILSPGCQDSTISRRTRTTIWTLNVNEVVQVGCQLLFQLSSVRGAVVYNYDLVVFY